VTPSRPRAANRAGSRAPAAASGPGSQPGKPPAPAAAPPDPLPPLPRDPWAYVALAGAAAGYALGFSWLREQHLERTHLPEYGVAAWLAWRAVAPLAPGMVAGYVAAAALAAELLRA